MASRVAGLRDSRAVTVAPATDVQRSLGALESVPRQPSGCAASRAPSECSPDILATAPHPPSAAPEAEAGNGSAMSPAHHYPGVAPPYSRAVPVGAGDPRLASGLLPALYSPLPGQHPHPGIPVAGRPNDLAMAGFHPMHTTDPGLGPGRLGMGGDGLPDIVHSHSIVPTPTPRPNQHRSGTSAAAAASRHQRQRQQHGRGQGGRSRGAGGREGGRSTQHRRRSRNHSSSSSSGGLCKEPCVKCLITVTSLRWVLLVLSMLGVLFVVSGIVMAALHAVGNDFLIYALVFIGLGVVLVAVVVVAWKCTPHGSEPIHALFNLGESRSSRQPARRPRRTHRYRDGQWHGGLLYPEFQYRRPPPTYAASMQAYQMQLADTQLNNNTMMQANNNSDDYSLPGSPPPSYRSRASTIHSGVHITFPPGHDSAPNSRPPTYRSRADTRQRPSLPLEDFAASSAAAAAPADVSFIGPVMTAGTVQQIIGTDRRHRRQRSDDMVVWHTRSSSLDLVQSSDVVLHRRVASLDNSNVNMVFNLNSEGTGASPLRTSSTAADREPTPNSNTDDVVQQAETASHHTSQSEGVTNIQIVNGQTQSSQGAQAVGSASVVDQESINVNVISLTGGGVEDCEPEQYNTAL